MIDEAVIQRDFRAVIDDARRGAVAREAFWVRVNGQRHDFECAGDSVRALGDWQFGQDADTVVLSNGSKTVRIGLADSRAESELDVSCVATTVDGDLALGSANGALEFARTDGTFQTIANAHYANVLDVQFFPSKQVVASMGLDYSVKIWSFLDGSNPRTLRKHTASLTGLAIIGKGRNVVTGARDGAVYVWQCATGEAVWEFRRVREPCDPVVGLAVLDDGTVSDQAAAVQDTIFFEMQGKNLLVAHESGVVAIYDMETRSATGELFAGKNITAMDAHEDLLVTGHSDGTVRCFKSYELCWEQKGAEEVRKIQIAQGKIFCLFRQLVALTPKGEQQSILYQEEKPNNFTVANDGVYTASLKAVHKFSHGTRAPVLL
ncbi:hypothetical protein OGAPHI_004445 [Ogataea philodendri]|uniref:Uncharacterized protein n=1 Tax=Ogataea philodendri TaxID=1378263 RepID=A0A9P8T4Z3_9ASCO|nr:uncharacterized protein OGAPHI_004445 [Ogataea philodendri]KAH3666256.1 hypothetical protein OGAPHI_004445 [Ogataea philodendri]